MYSHTCIVCISRYSSERKFPPEHKNDNDECYRRCEEDEVANDRGVRNQHERERVRKPANPFARTENRLMARIFTIVCSHGSLLSIVFNRDSIYPNGNVFRNRSLFLLHRCIRNVVFSGKTCASLNTARGWNRCKQRVKKLSRYFFTGVCHKWRRNEDILLKK